MRRFAVLALAAGLSLGLVAGAVAATPAAVPARDGWVTTGIGVAKGHVQDVQALGYAQTAQVPALHVPGVSKSASGLRGRPAAPGAATPTRRSPSG